MSRDSRAALSFADQVAAATGLAGMLAEGALRRCCERANVELRSLTPRDLSRLLPYLEPVLMLYLEPDQLQVRMEQLRQLADSGRRK
jgi:hypothetical protein